MKATFFQTGTGRTGSEQIFVAPYDGIYRITAAGAAGSGGNVYGTSFTPSGGRGAAISADFALKAGDVLRLIVGQPGGCVQATAKDGTSGGGGGATFILRNIPVVSDSRYQYTKAGQAFEALLVAAGGGGANDSAYQSRQDNGLDGIGSTWYSPTNYVSPTSANGTGSATGGGIQQFINYDAQGFYYSRNSGEAVGGYGGGGASDDSRAGGGGWYISNYQAFSWCSGSNVNGQTGGNSNGGYVAIEWTEIISTLITDRMEGAAYNASDLNRVGYAMLYVAARLHSCGLGTTVTPRTGWTRSDKPTESEMALYIQQLSKLRQTLTMPATTPAVPVVGSNKNWLTASEANDIERILADIDTLITNMIAAWFYSGDLYMGEI